MPDVAARVRGIEKSATYAILDMVRDLRARGADVLDLGGGEPDFDTPAHISAAAVEAIHEGFTHYTPSSGLPELRVPIAEKLVKDNGIPLSGPSDVIVTPSAKHALSAAVLTVVDPGDDLLIPTPSWVSYAAMARLGGARPVFAELDGRTGFRLTREALDQAVTKRTKAILVNTPNNPTGHLFDEDELAVLVDFAERHDLFIVSDEIYEKVSYVDRPHLSPAAFPGGADRTLTVNGFSKGYAMTGWRLGYVAGPTAVIGQVLKVQQHTVGCAGSFTQRGAVAALTGPQDAVRAMTASYRDRRDLLVDGLNRLPGVRCEAPDGALYVFPDVTGTGRGTSQEFTAWLLEAAGVAVTPGAAFGPGGEGHVRLSFATSPEVLTDALRRMAAALDGRS